MRRLSSFLAAGAICVPLFASTFSVRFEELKKAAAPAQLYGLLYDLPKGGDLHNHAGGSDRAEWILEICTDSARNGGDMFYTRAHIAAEPDTIAPGARYRTSPKH